MLNPKANNLHGHRPSMKVPPKRKGNALNAIPDGHKHALNESPSEKEGK